MNSTKVILSTALLTTSAFSGMKAGVKAESTDKKNVLFIIVDDLRPELNSYGVSGMITPNLDKLAQNGLQMNQAYCNIPVSGASRASLMTGLRPGKSRWWDVNAEIDKEAPEAITLPKHFKENGYTTISNSKVIHGKNDAKDSWSKIWKPKGRGSWRNYLGDENLEGEKSKGNAYAYECLDVPDSDYFDGATADKTIKDLRQLKDNKQPFFLAVGILKPHLPFNAPKKYWDLYKESDIQLPANYNMDRSSYPKQAFHTWNEIRFYKNLPQKGPLEDTAEAKRLIHGYKACVSYADAQIGRIMDELKNLGLDKNTVVVLIGDHGWSLGDHGEWCKHSNFSVVNRSVCFVSAPDLNKGKKVDEVIEFVDLYPTICDLAGVEKPAHLEGESFKTLISKGDSQWKNTAVVKWHNGISLMTPEYRYTEWFTMDSGKSQASMLFKISDDPQENRNLAKDKKYDKIKEKLKKEMEAKMGFDL